MKRYGAFKLFLVGMVAIATCFSGTDQHVVIKNNTKEIWTSRYRLEALGIIFTTETWDSLPKFLRQSDKNEAAQLVLELDDESIEPFERIFKSAKLSLTPPEAIRWLHQELDQALMPQYKKACAQFPEFLSFLEAPQRLTDLKRAELVDQEGAATAFKLRNHTIRRRSDIVSPQTIVEPPRNHLLAHNKKFGCVLTELSHVKQGDTVISDDTNVYTVLQRRRKQEIEMPPALIPVSDATLDMNDSARASDVGYTLVQDLISSLIDSAPTLLNAFCRAFEWYQKNDALQKEDSQQLISSLAQRLLQEFPADTASSFLESLLPCLLGTDDQQSAAECIASIKNSLGIRADAFSNDNRHILVSDRGTRYAGDQFNEFWNQVSQALWDLIREAQND